MSSVRSAPACFCGLADRNGKHRAHCATHLLDIARLLVHAGGSVVVMRDVGTCVDGLVRRDGEHLAHVVRAAADPLRQGPWLLIMIAVM